MVLSRILFQRGLFFVESTFYGLNDYIPYEADEYNRIIECNSMDISTIRNCIHEMSTKCILVDDYELYSIDE